MAFSSPPPPSPFLPSLLLLFFSNSLFLPILSRATQVTSVKGVHLGNPVLNVTLSDFNSQLSLHGSKDALFCERVKVSGRSRLELGSYANSFRVTLAPSAVIPERLHDKIQVCFHRNDSLGLCHCEKDEWKTVQKGVWSSVMSPYENRYVDVKFTGKISVSVTITVEEDSQQWRLSFLVVGFVLLLLAPIVSSWVPFYYSTSMAIGVLLVVIILLFQGMKLLPTGRKNFFYLSIYGSVLGAGTYVLHHISMLVNSIVVNFGLSEEMHSPVYIFVLVGIVLAGAALGYWTVRKFVITRDGSVNAGVAQFVKWAMRIIATTFIFQSTLDTLLAMTVLVSSSAISSLALKWCLSVHRSYSGSGSAWIQPSGQTVAKHKRAEFLSRSIKISPEGRRWNSPKSLSAWANSPVKGLISPSTRSAAVDQQDYYSTFHKTPKRKKFTKKQWEDFTRETTHQAVAKWAASPEVANWIIVNADRIQLHPSDYSSEETMGSESDSTDETVVGTGKGFSLFNW